MGSNASIYDILLVEDTAADAFILEQVFEIAGLPVRLQYASSGEEALDTFDAGSNFSLVLLDLGLPGVSGLEVLANIRMQQRWRNLPVIVVTRAEWPSDLARISDWPPVKYFRKPFSLVEYMELPKLVVQFLQSAREPLPAERNDAQNRTLDSSS
jgi:CheY-like chemotaxis protein